MTQGPLGMEFNNIATSRRDQFVQNSKQALKRSHNDLTPEEQLIRNQQATAVLRRGGGGGIKDKMFWVYI
jgi:hypothetical protein